MKKLLCLFISLLFIIPTVVLADETSKIDEETNMGAFVYDDINSYTSSELNQVLTSAYDLSTQGFNVYVINTNDDNEQTLLMEKMNYTGYKTNVIGFVKNINSSTYSIYNNITDSYITEKMDAIDGCSFSSYSMSYLIDKYSKYLSMDTVEEITDACTSDSAESSTDYYYNEESNVDAEQREKENSDSGYKAVVKDDANILTDEEETKTLENIYKITPYGHVLFYSSYSGCSSQDYTCSAAYGKQYFKSVYGENAQGVMYMIDMSARYLYIFSDGKIYSYITRNMADSITDKYYKYASNGDYYTNVTYTFDAIYSILQGEKFSSPMRYITAGLFSLSLSAIATFLFAWKKSGVKAKKGKDLVKYAVSNIAVGDVMVNYSHTTRIYNPPSSSGGSSGGGGGGGGGGGSSGGGGGHGF